MSTNERRKHYDDFVMTCPYFIGLAPSEEPELIVVEGVTCACLFTDTNLVEVFHRRKYGESVDADGVEVLPASDRLALIKLLGDLKPQLAIQDCVHVAIEQGPGGRVLFATIDELINGL